MRFLVLLFHSLDSGALTQSGDLVKLNTAGCLTLAIILATTTAASAAPDACGVVATSDVNAVFAPRVFEIDKSAPVVPKLSAKFAQVSNCTFVSKGASVKDMVTVSVGLRLAPGDETGVTIKTMKEGAIKLGATPVDVPGLGDGAYWIKLGGRQLVVLKGKRIMLSIGDYAPKRSDAEAVADLKKVAQAALAKL